MVLNELGILAVAALFGAFGGLVAAIFRSWPRGFRAYARPILIGATAGVIAIILALSVTGATAAHLLAVIGPALIAGLGGSGYLAGYVESQQRGAAVDELAEAIEELEPKGEQGDVEDR